MKIRKNSKIRHLVILLPLTLGIVACDNGDDPKANDELGVEEIIDLGWNYFSENNYSDALELFEAAISRSGNIADAHNGAGWSHGHMRDGLTQATNSFSNSYSIDTTMYDALGGWAFATFELGNWVSAIEKSDSLLNRRPGWRFLHESNTNFHD
jgi:tetratricopeptide (TPR) repeat protein